MYREVRSVVVGTNADLMADAARLYIEPDDVVLDATYGRGTFWHKLPGFPTIAHDLDHDGVDLRALPEAAHSIDVVVLDPPYRLEEWTPHNQADFADRYGIDGTHLRRPEELRGLYRDGIVEARRVLNPRGRLLVKCQEYGHGRGFVPVVTNLCADAGAAGFELVDSFVLIGHTGPGSGIWETQHRARRAHSNLLVFSATQFWRRRTPMLRPERTADDQLAFDSQ